MTDFFAEACKIVTLQEDALDDVRDTIMRGDGWRLPKRYDADTGEDRVEYPRVESVDACSARLSDEAAEREAYAASPYGRIMAAAQAMYDRGIHELSLSIRSACERGIVAYPARLTSADACGTILRVLDGINTEASRVILRAVADNLHSL